MSPRSEIEALNEQAEAATELMFRKRSTTAIENSIELALTHMSVAEVKEIVGKMLEYLEEFG